MSEKQIPPAGCSNGGSSLLLSHSHICTINYPSIHPSSTADLQSSLGDNNLKSQTSQASVTSSSSTIPHLSFTVEQGSEIHNQTQNHKHYIKMCWSNEPHHHTQHLVLLNQNKYALAARVASHGHTRTEHGALKTYFLVGIIKVYFQLFSNPQYILSLTR